MVKQISLQSDKAFEDLEAFYKERREQQTDVENPFASISHPELLRLFQKMLGRFHRTIIIIDALDEIESQRTSTIQTLRSLYADDGAIKLLFTSRSLEDIRELLKGFDPIQISAQSSDLTRYVEFQIFQRMDRGELQIKDDSLKEHIMARLVEKADGM
jgi:hypothetical protein